MKNNIEDMYSSLKLLHWFGKLFCCVLFSIEGPIKKRNVFVSKFDIVLKLIQGFILSVLISFYLIDILKQNLYFNFQAFTEHAMLFSYLSLMPLTLIFGTLYWRKISDIFLKMQHLCYVLEKKNINVNYIMFRKYSAVLISFSVAICFVCFICGLLSVRNSAFKLILCFISSLVELSVKIHLIMYLFMVKTLASYFKMHIAKQGIIELEKTNEFFKEIASVHYDLFLSCKLLNRVFDIITVKIITTWIHLVFTSYLLVELWSKLNAFLLCNLLVWNMLNFSGIVTIIYSYESNKNEVC